MSDDHTTSSWALASPEKLASDAGAEIFHADGNAVDAAVAAMLRICVMRSWSCSLGGYGGSLTFYDAKQKAVSCIDFDSKAPYAFKPGPDQNAEAWQRGYLALGVPGVVAGLALAVEKFGTKKWSDVVAPAIRLADDGVDLDEQRAKNVAAFANRSDKTSINAMFPNGRFPRAGERWVQKHLAALLRRVAQDPRSFYHGEIPSTIVKQVQANGGILAEEDFTRYAARVGLPIAVNYHGVDLFCPPPPSEGVTTLSILKTLESFDMASREKWGATYFELFAEAAKLCWDDRRAHLGDPDFVKVPVAEMISEKWALARADRIRNGPAREDPPVPPGDRHTANVIAMDAERNMVSLTSTMGGGWGARVAIEGLGLALGHGMSRFSPDPNSPNYPAPGKRVQHNMSPLVMLDRERNPLGVVGVVGGVRIPTATAQLVIGLLDFKATPAQTLDAPRIHTEGNEPLELMKNARDEVFNELGLMGHEVKRVAGVAGPLNAAILSEDRKSVTIASTASGGVATGKAS
jgi:gamma-glutamyltranspeptidase / glutathione hydrolase